MIVYHVILEKEGEWYCARAMEDESVFTQGKSIDEIVENVREVAELLRGEKHVQIELIVPPGIHGIARSRRRHKAGKSPAATVKSGRSVAQVRRVGR